MNEPDPRLHRAGAWTWDGGDWSNGGVSAAMEPKPRKISLPLARGDRGPHLVFDE